VEEAAKPTNPSDKPPESGDKPLESGNKPLESGNKPREVKPPPPDPRSYWFGNILLAIGTLGLLVGSLFRSEAASGGVVAAAIFTVLVGLCVRFPSLLQDGTLAADMTPNYSSMRVIVLMVVAVFAVLTIKVGWTTAGIDKLKIDESWAWVLAAALGGKVTQSVFAEKVDPNAPGGKQ
jgi:hypothetical protein